MSDLKAPKKKNESGIHGKCYERKTLTLIALKCLLNTNIKDFCLFSNPKDVEKFDDIIVLVEYENGERRLFMIQTKHKAPPHRPIVAEKLDGKDKQLGLEVYQEAFIELTQKDHEFFKSNNIGKETEIFYILYNNCNVTREEKNCNIGFQTVSSSEYFDFIDSSSDQANVLKIVNKAANYNESFLKRFYFYTNQLDENQVLDTVTNCLEGNRDIAIRMYNIFQEWAEPRNETGNIYKLDIKTFLLESMLGNLQPPGPCEIPAKIRLLNTVNKFDITVISKNSSLKCIWTEVLDAMQSFYQDKTIELSSWEQSISNSTKEKLNSALFMSSKYFVLNRERLNAKVTVKTLFLVMASLTKIPLFIKSSSGLFKIITSLLPLLRVRLVVFKEGTKSLDFSNNVTVFSTLKDVDMNMYEKFSAGIWISFNEKSKISLHSLLRSRSLFQYDSEVRAAVSVDTLLALLRETYTIGCKRSLPAYYINRQIKVPVLTKKVLDEEELLFVICNFPNKKTKYRTIYVDDYLRALQTQKQPEYHIITIFEDISNVTTQFVNVIEKYLISKRIYYLLKYVQCDKDYLFSLIHTNGGVDVLRPYLATVTKQDTELLRFCNDFKINIICNDAGMGKSMLLNFLDLQYLPHEWVIHVKLGEFASSLKKIRSTEELMNFIYKTRIKVLKDTLPIFFKAFYNHLQYKIIWLIDDYEEVNEPHLLSLFAKANRQGIRIWIATRPSSKLEFETTFNTFCMELTQFSKEDQSTFLRKYLEQNNKSGTDSNQIMHSVENMRNLFEDSFVGISQQTMMLAEIFLKHEGNWEGQQWHIDDLYERFINVNAEKYDNNRDFYVRTVSKVALKFFFKESALVKVFDLEECEQDINIFKNKYPKDFLITGFTDDDVPIFSHRTYAEFLTARWIEHTVRKQMKNETPFNVRDILKMLYLKELTTVRLFFDNMLTKNVPLHSAIVNQETKIINRIIQGGDTYFSQTDILGRTVFHIMSSYGNYYEVQSDEKIKEVIRNTDERAKVRNEGTNVFLNIPTAPTNVSKVNPIEELLKRDIWSTHAKKDTFLGLPAVDYTLLSGSLSELNAILKCKNPEHFPLQVNKPEHKYFLLFHCIQNSFNDILFKMNLEDIHHIKVCPSGMSLLHLAIVSKNIEAATELTRKNYTTDWGVDNEGNTPLHLACDQKDDRLLEIFLNVKETNRFSNITNNKGENPLHFLARRGHDFWIKKLIDDYPGIKIDAPCNDGSTPFMVSIIYRNIDVARILFSHGARVDSINDKRMTPLHYAISKGFLDCTRSLIKWGAHINHSDDYGMTPLMRASTWGHRTIAKLLLEKKADINACDSNNWTALHYAIKRNKIKVVSLLLRNNADINITNNRGDTPLTMSCWYNVPDAVKLLINHNANTNSVLKKRKKALKIAIKKEHKRCIDLLLQAEANM